MAISIATAAVAVAATILRPSINRAELRPVDVLPICVRAYVHACVHSYMHSYAVHIISLQSPTITLIKHEITAEK